MKRYHMAALLVLLIGFGLAVPARAQLYPQGDIAFVVGVPQGEFQDKVDNAGFGLTLFGGLGLGRTPIVIGLDGGFLVYGFERRYEPFSPTIPDVRVRVETSNAIAMGHLVLRVQPPTGAVQPYVDGLFGVKYFFTETTIRDDDRFDEEELASTTNFDDAALSYGVGAGLDVQIFGGRGGAVMLNAGARYLLGREAEYLQEGSIERRNGALVFAVDRSETDILLVQLGVTVKF
jgi:hypothetical protein